MLRFDLSAYYSLLDVFDRTGRLMFPKSWNGEEAWARDSENPEAIRERRKALFATITTVQREMAPLHVLMGMHLSDDELQDTSDRLGRLGVRLKEAKAELAQLPQVSDIWVEDHASFSRREAVEQELARAFAAGDLGLMVGPHRIVPWTVWCQRPDFRVHYGLSMIRIPRGESALRRGPAFVEKDAFEIWAERFSVTSNEPASLTPVARCREWLRAEVRATGRKTKTVEDYTYEAQALFAGLSQRAFLRIWAETVPDDWRQGGRMQGH